MLTEHPTPPTDAELEQRLERQILQRTWGRIHQLRVEARPDRAVIHGYTSSYYAKQLAIQAVREVLDSVPVELDIEVGSVPGST
jgi:hypothetical protein